MHEVRSLSLFVGTGMCNANCGHCAGKVHRTFAPKEDGVVDEDLVNKVLNDCYLRGARSISVSSSGEPTLSPLAVTRVFELIKQHGNFNWLNLYSNGIRIGEDLDFCRTYLRLWKSLGLCRIYVTVHDVNEEQNAKIYGIMSYPSLKTIVGRIHDADVLLRANLILSKNNIGTLERFVFMADSLREKGFDNISAWPIRGVDDDVDLSLSPSMEELDKMQKYAFGKDYLKVMSERTAYHNGEKLTLFPNGRLSSSWCN
jgi:MoaA/NifB/PqqE/SkfB family radical SAM enzyme